MNATPAKLLKKLSFGEEQLKGSVAGVQTKSEAGPEFDFRMIIPRQWEATVFNEAVPKLGGLPELIVHVSPSDSRMVELTVWCTLLDRELNPVDYLTFYMQKTDRAYVDLANHRTSYGILGDGLLHSPDATVPGTSRIFTVKDGNRLFLIQALSQTDDPQQVHLMQNMFLLARASFELLKPTKDRFAEPFEIEALAGDKPLPYFLKPQSWTTKPIENPPDGGDALILDNDGVGTMLVAAVPGQDGDEWLQPWVHEIMSSGEAKMTPLDKGFVFVPNETFSTIASSFRGILSDEIEMLGMVTRFKGEKASGAVGLLTPSVDSAPMEYAINRRAFEVLLESLEMP